MDTVTQNMYVYKHDLPFDSFEINCPFNNSHSLPKTPKVCKKMGPYRNGNR